MRIRNLNFNGFDSPCADGYFRAGPGAVRWSAIEAALNDAGAFLLLASPAAAQSV